MAEQPLNGFNTSSNSGINYQSRPTQYLSRSKSQSFLDLRPKQTDIQQDAAPIHSASHQISQEFRTTVNHVPSPSGQINQQTQVSNQEFDDETTEILAQQFKAPIYLNNYSGEYEDNKYRRYSLHAMRMTKKLVLGTGLVAAVLLAGVSLIFLSWNNSKNIVNAQSNKWSGSSTGNNQSVPVAYPSTVDPTTSQVNSYTVGATQPRYLIIPKLNVTSEITPVNNTGNNLNSPSNLFNVGWWKNSSLPGQTGAVVLDGFTTNGISGGVFQSLNKLKAGDTFQVEIGNTTKFNYKVLSTQSFGDGNLTMDQAISPVNESSPSLNIITCNGNVAVCGSTNSDFVVFAQQT